MLMTRFAFRSIVLFLFIAATIHYCGYENSDRIIKVTSVNSFLHKQASPNKQRIESAITLLRTFVLFNHTKHENRNACISCHHRNNNDDRIKTCAWCHQGKTGAKVIHTTCISCHQNKGGPTKCTGCHYSLNQSRYDDIKKQFYKSFRFHKKEHELHEKSGIQCQQCHNEATNSKQKQKCDSCHDGLGISKVLHVFCKECHKSVGAVTNCTRCHINIEKFYNAIPSVIALEKTGDRLGGITFNHKNHVEAYHTECIDCHHNGSLKKCSSCHFKCDKEYVINIKSAFHQQCHDCHNFSGGPRSCRGCHIQQKK